MRALSKVLHFNLIYAEGMIIKMEERIIDYFKRSP
jgi:hypothetical protein